MLGFIKKLFGGGGEACACGCESAAVPGVARPVAKGEADLDAFVGYVVRSLVDNPEIVKIASIEERGMRIIQVECQKSDIGKIIGKSGKTIAAIRTLAAGAAGRGGQRVDVRILE
jgi:predicted RNA-binding protein YlqC (UPF0109 family)